MIFIVKLFLIAFFLNLLYEMLHSLLYKTCHEASLPQYIFLMLKGAFFDAFAITTVFLLCSLLIPELWVILVFSAILLPLAYIWEINAIKNKRWVYNKNMPKIAGVGITPLVQLSLTGILSLYIAFNLK